MNMKTKRGEAAKLILGLIGVAGLAFVAASLPGIANIFPRTHRTRYQKRELEQSLRNLLKRGFVKFVQTNNGWKLVLTDKGMAEFFEYEIRKKVLKKPKRWDGKWRLLIFDIEEERKKIREQVRRTLVALDFYRLQDSVWVYPYECEEVLELLRTKYGIRHQALYIRAEKIAKDHWLKCHFKIGTD